MNVHELKALHPKRFDKEHSDWAASCASYDWWGDVFGEAKKRGLDEHGYVIEDLQFSGFWSQGDGASWSGYVNIPKFIKLHGLEDDPDWFVLHQMVNDALANTTVDIITSGRDTHEYTMQVREIEQYSGGGDHEFLTGILAGTSISSVMDDEETSSMLLTAEGYILDAARDFARSIYRELEEEYSYITSEESFIDHCEINEVQFEGEDDE